MSQQKTKIPRDKLFPRLSLAVQYSSSAQQLPTRAQFRHWMTLALKHDAMITLRIVDEAEGRELNRKYRGKNYATNVLTFAYDDFASSFSTSSSASGSGITIESSSTDGGEADLKKQKSVVPLPLCGDVVLCAPVVEREAMAQQKTLRAHFAHLTIHAALHLQGYDHQNDKNAVEMESLETALMLKLRYPDPYRVIRHS